MKQSFYTEDEAYAFAAFFGTDVTEEQDEDGELIYVIEVEED